MKRNHWLLALSLLLLVLMVTAYLTVSDVPKLKRARAGLDATVANLPETDEFILIANISGEDCRKLFTETRCCYAQAIIAVGSPLPRQEALAAYVGELKARGWVLTRGSPDLLPQESELVRGEHESITVRISAPGWMMESNEDYKRERGKYPSLVNVTVDHFLPSRKACMGE